jgi:betaine reductase
MLELGGKRIIAVGERDGVTGSSIRRCVESAGAEVVLELTHCFV